MLLRRYWIAPTSLAVASLAVIVLASTRATLYGECDMDCGPNNFVCTGGTTAYDCPGCVAGFASCEDFVGKISYSGEETHGSIMGTKTIDFVAIPCEHKRDCIAGPVVQGECNIAPRVCNTAGFGGCQTCELADPANKYTWSIYLDCQVKDPCDT